MVTINTQQNRFRRQLLISHVKQAYDWIKMPGLLPTTKRNWIQRLKCNMRTLCFSNRYNQISGGQGTDALAGASAMIRTVTLDGFPMTGYSRLKNAMSRYLVTKKEKSKKWWSKESDFPFIYSWWPAYFDSPFDNDCDDDFDPHPNSLWLDPSNFQGTDEIWCRKFLSSLWMNRGHTRSWNDYDNDDDYDFEAWDNWRQGSWFTAILSSNERSRLKRWAMRPVWKTLPQVLPTFSRLNETLLQQFRWRYNEETAGLEQIHASSQGCVPSYYQICLTSGSQTIVTNANNPITVRKATSSTPIPALLSSLALTGDSTELVILPRHTWAPVQSQSGVTIQTKDTCKANSTWSCISHSGYIPSKLQFDRGNGIPTESPSDFLRATGRLFRFQAHGEPLNILPVRFEDDHDALLGTAQGIVGPNPLKQDQFNEWKSPAVDFDWDADSIDPIFVTKNGNLKFDNT
jgi:hypothetical protein